MICSVMKMKILIDADACPVMALVLSQAEEYGIPCLLFCDTAHQIIRENAETVLCDKGADSTDFALVSRVSPGDLIITQDYGLASLCLSRRARVLHPNGWEYTAANIDALLLARHEARKIRAAGGRTKGPSKRTKAQDSAFSDALRYILSDQKRSQG